MATCGWPNPFPLRRYRLELQVERTLTPDALAAPVLRGVLGRALRRAVCVTGLPDCAGCALRERCAYPELFEARVPEHHPRRRGEQAPNPFVLESSSLPNEALAPGVGASVALTLVGPALERLDVVLSAFGRALADGVGKRRDGPRGSARLVRATIESLPGDRSSDHGAVVLGEGERRARAHVREVPIPPCDESLGRVELELRSPLRLLRDGSLIERKALRASDVLFSLLRRQASFVELQLGRRVDVDFHALRRLADTVRLEQSLERRSARRYSARQRRTMPLDGYVGTILLEGELVPFWPVLFLGQYLHLGKAATSGNGACRLVLPDDPEARRLAGAGDKLVASAMSSPAA